MTTIRLTNSATRRKEAFAPLDPDDVRMYVCGPTVYDRAHMGNARSAVVFDVAFRLLRAVYGPQHVTYVRNVTDVDDKINARAAETGRGIDEITAETGRWYVEDMAALGCLDPTESPLATAYIPQMVAMIERLVAAGHAYESQGHVLFSVASYAEYGALSGRSVEDMVAGARVEVAPYKRDPMDFVLWKPAGPGTPGWKSPWGRGRPGWHIECSAMSEALLGETFDIHAGGGDLMFPHHENEIAQSACVHGGAAMARVWLHNEMLQVEGRKMSKSLGNFFTVRDRLDEGVPGEVMRMAFLLSHYRSPMNLGVKRWHEARVAAADLAIALGSCGEEVRANLQPSKPLDDVIERLADDLDTPGAIAALRRAIKSLRKAEDRTEYLRRIYASQIVLGFDFKQSQTSRDRAADHDHMFDFIMTQTELAPILNQIREARESRNFEKADKLKRLLEAAGVELKIGGDFVSAIRLPHFDRSALSQNENE